MDLMAIRRRLIKQMASGAKYISGTFTVPSSGSNYTVNFGETFGSYLFLLEMTDESKASVLSSGSTYARAYAYIGIYPRRSINNTPSQSILYDRYNPSTSASSYDALTGTQLSLSSITLDIIGMTASGAASLVKGCTYNYVVVSLDNI